MSLTTNQWYHILNVMSQSHTFEPIRYVELTRLAIVRSHNFLTGKALKLCESWLLVKLYYPSAESLSMTTPPAIMNII